MKRRSLFLAGAAALAPASALAVPQVPAAPHPDAALIAACRAMMKAQRAYNAVYEGPDAIEDDDMAALAAAPFAAQRGVLLDELERLRATTAEGIAARAGALAVHAGHGAFSFDHHDTMTGRMLDYLLRDAAALPAEVSA